MLGYFSIIGLLRVHVLLGDFTLALKVMENIELNQKVCPIFLPAFLKANPVVEAFFTRVTACHVATYYYVGFSYMALRRYTDAIRTFVSILNFISRMRQYHTRSYQYDQVCIYLSFDHPVSCLCRSTKRPSECMRSLPSATPCHQAGWTTRSYPTQKSVMQTR